MAKRTKSRSRSLTIRVARGGGLRRRHGGALRRFGKRARHFGRKHAKHLPIVGLGLGAAAVGYAKGAGLTKHLPVIGDDPNLSLGLAGFALAKYTHNKYTRMAGLGALAIALAAFGEEQGKKHPVNLSGDDDVGEDYVGDEDLAGY